MASNPPVKLVIFDLFGTLVQYGVMHHPFRKLLKWARDNGRQVRSDDARYLMTNDLELTELAQCMGIFPPVELLDQISAEIGQELNSLGLFDDVLPTLNKLHEKGIAIAVCSNLAHPYGRAIELLPAHIPYLSCMSYEVGFIKPEREIYQWILNRIEVDMSQCLFVGDTFHADFEGPSDLGMRALHLVRNRPAQVNQIGSLLEIFMHID
jgi:FMN phosphatase YigB (HAD superfamily)